MVDFDKKRMREKMIIFVSFTFDFLWNFSEYILVGFRLIDWFFGGLLIRKFFEYILDDWWIDWFGGLLIRNLFEYISDWLMDWLFWWTFSDRMFKKWTIFCSIHFWGFFTCFVRKFLRCILFICNVYHWISIYQSLRWFFHGRLFRGRESQHY